MKLKNYLSILAFVFLFGNTSAQRWLQSPYLKSKPDSSGFHNFYDIQRSFQKYERKVAGKNNIEVDDEKDEGVAENKGKFEGYMSYKRWEWFTEQRVFPTGSYPSQDMIIREYQKFLHKKATTEHRSNGLKLASTPWVNLSSPNMPAKAYGGVGRVDCMAIMPGNNNTLLIGAACGGVWKSTDGGQTWAMLNTDQLPSLSITSICIDPLNTDNIYVATGDHFTGIPGSLKPGHYSAGIFKSNDAGLTWVLAGFPATQAQQFIPQQLIIDPITPSTLLLASNTGIWKSVDSGTNWTLQQAGFFYSIEFNPLNRQVVFATDWQGLWRSNNTGTSWVYRGGGYPNTFGVGGRVTVAVTPADTNIVYTWGKITNASSRVKKYTNAGNTFNGFVNMTDPYLIAQPYGYVDMAIAVSPINAQNIMVGGITTAKSINGGTSWVQASDFVNDLLPNYFHCDVKKIVFEPGSGSKLYALHDGGIDVSTDNSVSWNSLSNGLQITEIYKLASDPSDEDIIYYGAQDNGTNRWNKTNDSIVLLVGGDGFQPLVDPNNPLIIFSSAQVGTFKKSIDGGVNFFSASPGQTLWNPPFKFNPLNSQTMYVGCVTGLKKSVVGGLQGSYVNMTVGSLVFVKAFDVSKADTNYQYAASADTIIRTINNGANWSIITPGLPVGSAAISYITCSTSDPNKVWVTFSGYSSGNKVFMSNDGGSNWINYSGTLPNVPVNCMVYFEGGNDEVYIGTDFGVFYRNAQLPDWVVYSTGLPNVIVGHLDIHYGAMKLRAGTYGRGLWETDLVITGNPLPVDLLSFTGSHNPETQANDLQWVTASETNCNYFEIMKSNDSRYFSSIALVNCAGNSNQLNTYNYSDKQNGNDNSYYFLKQYDFDGTATPSKIIFIRNKIDENTLLLFPNPTNDKLHLQLLRKNETYDVELFDVFGKKILMQASSEILAGEINTLDVSFLNSGVYVLKLSENSTGEFLHGKFVKK